MNFLWLTKQALIKTTAKECGKWGMLFCPIIGSSAEKVAQIQLFDSLPMPTHLITNYDAMLNKDVYQTLNNIKWDVIVIDEVHQLKGGANPTPTGKWKASKNFILAQKSMQAFVEGQKRVGAYPMFLSGSIINNRPEELWAYLHIFDPERFPNVREFQQLFANQEYLAGIGWTPKKLLEALAPSLLRRRKDEVAKDLPAKNILDPFEIELDPNTELYHVHKMLVDDFFTDLDGMDNDTPLTITSILARLHYMRSVLIAPGKLKYNYYPIDPDTGERASEPTIKHLTFARPYTKLEAIMDHIDDLVMEGERVVVFSAQYNTPLDYMHEQYKSVGIRSAVVKGGVDYSKIQEDFQQANLEILLINAKTGAEGLNLHRSDEWPGGASRVVMIDEWWNPEVNRQAEERCYRIGTNKPVFVQYTHVLNSVDEIVRDIAAGKFSQNQLITESAAFRAGTWKEKIGEYLR